MNALLVDDENSALETLRLMLGKFCPEIKVLGSCNGIEDILTLDLDENVDVIFLDINFGDYTGFDILKKIPLQDVEVIFVTAFDNYGVEAVKQGVFDYIIKPVDPEELMSAVNRLFKLKVKFNAVSKSERKNILIPINNTQTKITLTNLVYVEADGSYSRLQEGNTSHFCSKPIKYFEEVLPNQNFFRVHHSYIVNLEKVKSVKVGRDQPLILEDGKEIPVARNKRKRLIELLQK